MTFITKRAKKRLGIAIAVIFGLWIVIVDPLMLALLFTVVFLWAVFMGMCIVEGWITN